MMASTSRPAAVATSSTKKTPSNNFIADVPIPDAAGSMPVAIGPSLGYVGDSCTLVSFLQNPDTASSLKTTPAEFYQWLLSEDIMTITDLVEACGDQSYVKNDMQRNGLRGFRRTPFQKAVSKAAGGFVFQRYPTDLDEASDSLSSFLLNPQIKACLKCTPQSFREWLNTEDVETIDDLAEACMDDEYVREDMQENGLKGFKRGPFQVAVRMAVDMFRSSKQN